MRWRLWLGRRERFALSLFGVLVLGIGLSIIATLTDSVRGTVRKAYEQTWRAPYDILVHVPLPEGEGLRDITEPNLLTTLPPGISLQQWQEIRTVPGVQVAAPVAVVGYVRFGPTLTFPSSELPISGAGLYRITSRVSTTASGTEEGLVEERLVAVVDPGSGPPQGLPTGTITIDHRQSVGVSARIPTFLVGIDPEAENQLIGLESALTRGSGLVPGAPITRFEMKMGNGQGTPIPVSVIPVLVNANALRHVTYTLTVEELDAQHRVKRSPLVRSWEADELADGEQEWEKQFYTVLGQSGSVHYDLAVSPYPDRWPVALELQQSESSVVPSFLKDLPGFRSSIEVGTEFRSWRPVNRETQFQYQVRGVFDASRLPVVKDPRSQMPLMTYRPSEAWLVLDAGDRPLNPPRQVGGGISPVGFLSSPPALLTSIEGAVALAGEQAINAIQVKVTGAERFTPEAVNHVRQVAAEIERRTGLVAEVTMGSSPVQVLVRIPGENGGWAEEVWIHKGAAVTTVHQVEFGYGFYAALIVLMAVFYALATGLGGLTARRRELGLVVALGWPGGAIRQMVLMEQIILALAAGLPAAAAALLAQARLWMVPAILAVAVLIWVPAALLCCRLVIRMAPGEGLRWGDIAPGRRVLPGAGVLSLAVASLMGRPVRTALTLLATSLPTALLLVLVFISRYLQGVLYTNLTGEYAAMRVGSLQYAAGLVCLAVAALTAFDLIRQNAEDHRPERALLHALGWPRRWIVATMVVEGSLLGLGAGVIGSFLGACVLVLLYGPVTAEAWQVAALVGLLPVALGTLTGLLTSLVESRSWGRSTLAGVQPRAVLRVSFGAWVGASFLALLLVGWISGVWVSRLTTAVQAREAPVGQVATTQAADSINAAVATQNAALAALDQEAYLSTLDPMAEPYRLQQQHWFEDIRRWRQSNPGGQITRTVSSVSFLGGNTAHVTLVQRIVPSQTASAALLRTVWVRSPDGSWVQYGNQHEVLQEGELTVWYPDGMDPAVVRETMLQAQKALDSLKRFGYTVGTPLILEIKPDQAQFHASLGPSLDGVGIGQFWTDFGEPLRLYLRDGPPSEAAFAFHLSYKLSVDRSGGHAPLWFREGIRMAISAKVGGLSLQERLRGLGVYRSFPLSQFQGFDPNVNRDSQDFTDLVASGLLFVWYLQAEHGPEALDQVFAKLTDRPPDPRSATREIEVERNRATVEAVEQVVGVTWAELDKRFMHWVKTQVAEGVNP